MLLFAESFGHYNTVGSTLNAVTTSFATGWNLVQTNTSATIAAGFDGEASRSLRFAANSSGSTSTAGYIERTLDTIANVVIIGFEFTATARCTLLSIPTVLELEWPDKMAINGVAGGPVPVLNTNYYAEIKIEKSTGAVTMMLNGFPYLTTTVTAPVPDSLSIRMGITNAAAGMRTANLSNIYFVDSSAGKYTDFLTPQGMITLAPNESIAPQEWEPVPNTKTNLQIMNNMPPRLNEYTRSDMIGEKDYYKATQALDIDNVTAVVVNCLIGKTDIDPQKVAIGVSDGTTTKNAPDIDIDVQPTYRQGVFETDITNTDWTPITAQDAQFGITIRPRPE